MSPHGLYKETKVQIGQTRKTRKTGKIGKTGGQICHKQSLKKV